MKVKTLIRKLSKLDPDMPVVVNGTDKLRVVVCIWHKEMKRGKVKHIPFIEIEEKP